MWSKFDFFNIMNYLFLNTNFEKVAFNLNFKEILKRWCGYIYSTSECNYQMFNKVKQKVVFAAKLEGILFCWRNQSATKYLP